MQRAAANERRREERPEVEQATLAGQYRTIGISAVAAALPYRSESKNQAYAPVEPDLRNTLKEFA